MAFYILTFYLALEKFLQISTIFKNIKKSKRILRSGPASMARLARKYLDAGKNVVVVARSSQEMAELRSLLSLFSPKLSANGLNPSSTQWDRDFISLPRRSAILDNKSLWAERMAALYGLYYRHDTQGVLLSLDNFLYRLPPKNFFETHQLRLYTTMEMAPELIVDQAIDWGYYRVPMVSSPGEIAMRGDILDIFCPGYSTPVRLEFFGDSLDDIRMFNPSSQRSIGDCQEVHILPVLPIVGNGVLLEEAKDFWQKELKKGTLTKENVQILEEQAKLNPHLLTAGIFYENSSYIEDWLPPDSIFLLPDLDNCLQDLISFERSAKNLLKEQVESKGIYQPDPYVLRSHKEAEEILKKSEMLSFDELQLGVEENKDDSQVLPENRYDTFQSIFVDKEAQERPWQYLCRIIKNWTTLTGGRKMPPSEDSPLASHVHHWFASGDNALGDLAPLYCGKFILSFANERSRDRFLKLAEQDGIFPKLRYEEAEAGVFALISPFRQGISLAWEHSIILGEDVIQPRIERSIKASKAFKGLERYDTLSQGDYLVHRDYGVGVFDGLHRMAMGQVENDYLLLKYSGDDKLYLPVDRLALIQKYKGMDEGEPSLDKLGGNLWSSSRDKARKAIEKIAKDLVEMYALRKVVKGFSYGPVDEMYREFEATFGFEETPDQAKAIEDVLLDMEKPEPMDRLICGDVGFGKTEVALRASFRAALEGRQAAMLCPTTVLAEQHYQTFKSRLAGFPVNVGLLSRFVSRAKQKEVLKATANGEIDILIGTHRILSKDVELPKLGLLILDEEQRFGVRHKERLKEMRKNVDALTLTATPIPRTLQLSLSGIRELSIIETPPPERKPISTALIEKDDDTLREILHRELSRKGQIFWVYNRVNGLERVAEYVKTLAPNARIGVAHGQMSETALENAMRSFWVGDLDILVCTSIIESGLDFPKANTLIVDQAHMFGLGQLYQLRGRVGRSDRQAFAVFVSPELEKLTKVARQRLKIIMEMDHLGAGFQVAMEDLRLRGAGNILGESQSGHMNRIGLDLFLEMLEEEVAKLKGQPLVDKVDTELNIGVSALIPEEYIEDPHERLRYYKTLSSAQDNLSHQDIELEIKDRFGPLPVEVENFSAILHFKRKIATMGASKADILADKVRIVFSENSSLNVGKLVSYVETEQALGKKTRLIPPATLELALEKKSIKDGLVALESLLDKFTK